MGKEGDTMKPSKTSKAGVGAYPNNYTLQTGIQAECSARLETWQVRVSSIGCCRFEAAGYTAPEATSQFNRPSGDISTGKICSYEAVSINWGSFLWVSLYSLTISPLAWLGSARQG